MPADFPLLLVPGLICDDRVFAAQIAAFPGATAMPGWGQTDSLTAMAQRVLDTAPDRFALLGHSMGARVALEVIRIAPARVAALALVSTGVHPVANGEADKRHALRDIGRMQGMAALVDKWLPPMIATPAHERLYAPMRAMCIAQGLPAYEAQIKALLHRPEVDSLLPTIACPTLSCTGALDVWSPPAQHEAMAAIIPGASLTIVPNAGHFLPAEQPEALNAAIAAWLDRIA
ncbi:alpha/beta fold hydrolase [Novosphingobium sp. FSY-8]|uniref:Alpha/beta fold hydrolase n=1 Tax=Novosphingobium ovatum TaxID=1908523 RepID=A0ABW9XDW2_9SPHN|nr:alpha/beta hydrolase [Novosphingobium ovatum]NBC36725.1 alpha/beta fold hydrolase [Novosphingobium ovatum]